MLSFGDRLRRARERAGYSQASVCRHLNITTKAMSRYECNTADPSLELIARLIRLYDVSADYIMGLSPDMGHCPDSPAEDEPDIRERVDNLSKSSREKVDEYISMLETLDSLGNDSSGVADIKKKA